MRKLVGSLVVVFALVAVLVPSTASATHSNGQGPNKDFRNGSHKGFCPTPFGTFPCDVHVNGQSRDATGTGIPAQGNWFIRIYPGGVLGLDLVDLSGDVICLNAIGTSVWTRLLIVNSSTGLAPPGFTILDRAIDNGEGVNDPEDSSTGFLPPPSTTCSTTPFSTTPIESGNISAHDGI
jgi:hypothetical protein